MLSCSFSPADVHAPVQGVDGLQPRLLQEPADGVRRLHLPRRCRPARARRLRLRQGSLEREAGVLPQ